MNIPKDSRVIIINILGGLFLFLGLGAVLNSLYLKNPTQIFWICYLSLIIIGVGLLTKNSFLIVSQLNILAIPLIIWDIDFLYWLLFNKPLFGITDYFFLDRIYTLGKIISLQHLFTLPVALFATYLIKLKRKDTWKLSIVQIVLVFFAITIFTPSEANINCVFNPCINVYIGLPYRLTWFIILFVMIAITVNIINRLHFIRDYNEKSNL
jgi:hypothetical protein